jgi:hypothetical protein
VCLDGALGHEQAARDRAVGEALRDEAEGLAFARGQLAERVVPALPSDESRADGRVDNRLSLADAAERIDEDGDVDHALLQQIADPFGMLLQQRHRVARLDVLGEHEDADHGVVGPHPLGRDEALVGVGGLHADVDDRHVRLFEPVARRSGDDGFDIDSRSATLRRNRAVRSGDQAFEWPR